MTTLRQGLFCLTCLLIVSLAGACKPTPSDPVAQVDVEPAEPVSAMPAPAPMPMAPVSTAPPTIAIYPLLAEPQMLENASVDSLLAQLEHELTAVAGAADELVVLDRSDLHGETLSPERKFLATGPVADYVLSGLLVQRNSKPALRLQLSHVRSHRLVAVKTMVLEDNLGLNKGDVVQFLRSAAEQDRVYAQGVLDFRLSVAGILPAEGSIHRLPETTQISEEVTERLLEKHRFTLVAGEQAHALYLESHRMPDRTAVKRADIIVHARLLDSDSSDDGMDLVLFLERVDGLRKVIPLHAQTQAQMTQLVVESVDKQLNVVPEQSSDVGIESQRLVDQAWLEIYRNGRLFINGFPHKVTDKNRSRLKNFNVLIDKALALNPSNFEAIAGKALHARLMKDHALAYSHMQSLLWDPRSEAFDLGVQLLQKKLSKSGSAMGSTSHMDGNVAGLPAYTDEGDAVEDLTKLGWLTTRGKSDTLWWNTATRHAPIASHHADLWDYVFGLRNPDLDSLARYKVLRRPFTTRHAPGREYIPTGIDHRQSIYYALANTLAPLSLSVGKNGFYSAPVDFESHADDSEHLSPGNIYLFQKLAGMAALSNTLAIEPDLLYAAALCRYRQSLCVSSRQLYNSITYRSERFRQHVVSQGFNVERTTLYADGLIAMAHNKAMEKVKGAGKAADKGAGSVRNSNSLITASKHAVSSFRLESEALDQVRAVEGVLELCDNCAGLRSLNYVFASPNGRWLANSRKGYDVAGRYQPEPHIRAWMFDQGYIDVTGAKTVRNLPRKVVKQDLRRDFPELAEHQINGIISEFKTSTYKVDGSGRVEVHLDSGLPSLKISSPDLRREAHFGHQVALSDDKVIICDQWREGYQFSLFADAWELDRHANLFCDGSHLAMVNEWVIEASGGQIGFYTDDSDGYNRRALRDITTDFDTLSPGSFIESVRVHADLLVAKAKYRNDYFLLVYQFRHEQWQPVSLLEVPNHIADFEVFDDQVFQLNRNEILVYEFDGARLNLEYRYPVATPGNSSNPYEILLIQDELGDKLVISANRELLQIRLN